MSPTSTSTASFVIPSIFLLIIVLPLLIIISIIYVVSIKLNFKIKFNLAKFHQLTGVEIIKYKNNNDLDNVVMEIKIDKLWLSSCYINRQVNERIVICVNSFNLIYKNQNENISNEPTYYRDKPQSSNYFLLYLIYLYFKYIGTLAVENFNIDFLLNQKNKLNLNLKKMTINLNVNKTTEDLNGTNSYFSWHNNMSSTANHSNGDKSNSDIVLNNQNVSAFYFIKFQFDYLNVKLFDQINNLAIDLLVNKIVFNVFIKNEDYGILTRLRSDYYHFATLNDLLKKIQNFQLLIENPNLLFNRLLNINEPSYFKNYQFLIDYLNENRLLSNDQPLSLLKPSKINIFKCINKINFVSVKSFQSKFFLDSNNQKHESIKIEQIKFSEEKQKTLFCIKNVEYLKHTKGNLNLLKHILFERNEIDEKSNEVLLDIDFLNVYFYLSFFKELLNTKFVNNMLLKKSNENNDVTGLKRYFNLNKKINFKVNDYNDNTWKMSNYMFKFNMKNSFLHLIDNLSNQLQNRQSNCIYSLGAVNVYLNYTGLKLAFNLKHLIFFKSTKLTNNYQNNLLEMNSYSSILKRFNEINLNSNDKHFWGNLVSLNEFEFDYDSNKYFIYFDSLRIEFSPDFLKVANFLLDNSDNFVNFQIHNKISINEKKIVKFKIRKLNLFLVYEFKFLLDFQANEIIFSKIYRDIFLEPEMSLKMEHLSCVEYKIDDINQVKAPKSPFILNYCQIDFYSDENSQANFNLVFFVKKLNLNRLKEEVEFVNYLLSLDDVLCTWSLQIYFILHQTLLKSIDEIKNKINEKFFRSKPGISAPYKLNVLIESDILVNFLFDYSQDSSKCIPSTACPIQTVSFILYDFYYGYNSLTTDYCISSTEISAFINADDQNISSENVTDEESETETNQKTFFRAKMFKINKIYNDKTLQVERKMLNTKDKLNTLTTVSFDLFNVIFIYDYDFAKLIDHVLNLRKCFKLILKVILVISLISSEFKNKYGFIKNIKKYLLNLKILSYLSYGTFPELVSVP